MKKQDASIPYDFLAQLENDTRAMSGFFDLEPQAREELLNLLSDQEDSDRARAWLHDHYEP